MSSRIAEVMEGLDHQLILRPMQARFEEACRLAGQEPAMLYCAFPWPAEGHPVDNLDSVAAHGLCVFRRPRAKRRPSSRPYRSVVLISPTWLHVALIANASCWMTKRWSLPFFEGIERLGRRGEVTIYNLNFGR